jgi:hypothetical protein
MPLPVRIILLLGSTFIVGTIGANIYLWAQLQRIEAAANKPSVRPYEVAAEITRLQNEIEQLKFNHERLLRDLSTRPAEATSRSSR